MDFVGVGRPVVIVRTVIMSAVYDTHVATVLQYDSVTTIYKFPHPLAKRILHNHIQDKIRLQSPSVHLPPFQNLLFHTKAGQKR